MRPCGKYNKSKKERKRIGNSISNFHSYENIGENRRQSEITQDLMKEEGLKEESQCMPGQFHLLFVFNK